MKDVLTYNDFIGSVHYSTDDEVFFGKVEGIKDLITFEGQSVKEIKKSFIDAVEDYVSICNENNINPYKSFKGSFNIRLRPDLHKLAFQTALLKGMSLNQFVQEAITHEITEEGKIVEHAR